MEKERTQVDDIDRSLYDFRYEEKDEDFYRKCYVQECIYKMCGFAAEDAGELRSYEEYLKDR